jgi:hypothetical protein
MQEPIDIVQGNISFQSFADVLVYLFRYLLKIQWNFEQTMKNENCKTQNGHSDKSFFHLKIAFIHPPPHPLPSREGGYHCSFPSPCGRGLKGRGNFHASLCP